MALGAEARNVFFLVLGEALALLVAGIIVGVPAAIGAARILARRVSTVSARERPAPGIARSYFQEMRSPANSLSSGTWGFAGENFTSRYVPRNSR
jgi:hypothetical protein